MAPHQKKSDIYMYILNNCIERRINYHQDLKQETIDTEIIQN